ncbi:MAG TPA: DUF3426 domain-containing protein, partial [Caulobacteraceae bacterium]|nr:DUF3426 domain-containing protein [Caulobacteraceae bacterium]
MGAEIGDLVAEGACASDSPAMILTCPDCATRYFVEDERLSERGRMVRCGACGGSWAAKADAPLELTETMDIGATAQLSSGQKSHQGDAMLRDLPAEELPKVFRAQAQTKAKVREAAASGVVWAGLVAGFIFLIGLALFMRQDIAAIWPRAAGAYAMAGLPVDLVGLAIEGQHAQPALKDGHAVLAVSGALRNVLDRAVVAPPLRVSILDSAGHPVAVKIADQGGARIPPGEARHFLVDVVDPPTSAAGVDITFVPGAP